jgi:hypothetical protein
MNKKYRRPKGQPVTWPLNKAQLDNLAESCRAILAEGPDEDVEMDEARAAALAEIVQALAPLEMQDFIDNLIGDLPDHLMDVFWVEIDRTARSTDSKKLLLRRQMTLCEDFLLLMRCAMIPGSDGEDDWRHAVDDELEALGVLLDSKRQVSFDPLDDSLLQILIENANKAIDNINQLLAPAVEEQKRRQLLKQSK